MTVRTRTERAIVEYDECDGCDGCGAIRRTEALVGNDREKFDPRSRSHGWGFLYLWEAHPWNLKSLCRNCEENGRHMPKGIPSGIEGMIRIKVFEVERCEECSGKGQCSAEYCQGGWIYNERGLRLPEMPPTEEELDEWPYAVMLAADLKSPGMAYPEGAGEAIVLMRHSGYWMPNSSAFDPWWLDDDDRRLVLLCEPTMCTSYPTVIEPLMQIGPSPADPRVWGEEFARRTHSIWDRGFIMPYRIRIPMEILQ